ncbi:2'-5' RNA ligase family protein [Chamaesiphon sp. VAR_69_metabat_338]|uniref:2'-5' RNA ligase family protein n=1 Tax=Chamaesiphon sp. VAR_69_metabat_338 TaxID=2964704 RepID=UPI00286E1EBC|nr:2'-5' RNA ligase family protein [Chamaesiphon sp. VAR_69_metabat_338]
MTTLVVSYPSISSDSLAWIQDIRQEHDELNFRAIDPHFTLVFPIADLDREQLVSHVKQAISGTNSFEFVIRCAVLGNDAFSEYTHVFLVPEEGYSNIVKLHDRLYTGVIANELRLDLPFIPHIGIANSLDARSCKELVDRLNDRPFEICGRVDCLDIIWSQADRVGTITSVNLT